MLFFNPNVKTNTNTKLVWPIVAFCKFEIKKVTKNPTKFIKETFKAFHPNFDNTNESAVLQRRSLIRHDINCFKNLFHCVQMCSFFLS